MTKIRFIGLIVIMILMISCLEKKTKTEKMEKSKIVKVLSGANSWYIENKQSWQLEQSIDEGKTVWRTQIVQWIKESNYFSNSFIGKLESERDNDKHFGLYFYDYQDLGKMLKALCDENEKDVLKGLRKMSDGKYRYITYFSTVLNSIPDPNYDEKYLWLWETDDDGSRWFFSIVVIKENNKWVIDKIERWKTVLEE